MEEKKIHFVHKISTDHHLIGYIHTDTSNHIHDCVIYRIERKKKEWQISRSKGDIFKIMGEEEVGMIISCGNDRLCEKQFKRIQKLYTKIQIKIRYYQNTNDLLH